jgi:glutathione S-transferase
VRRTLAPPPEAARTPKRVAVGACPGHDRKLAGCQLQEGVLAMKLLSSLLSPYVRKVRIAAAMKGLTDRIELVATDTNVPNPELNRANPLAKVPALVVDGEPIFDSHVICEYLDGQAASPQLIPPAHRARIKTLTLAALADGILDAALLLVYEKRFRPQEKWHEPWQQRQQDKIDRALAQLEKEPPQWQTSPDYGHLTLACALGYLDFRHEGRWRQGHPKLVRWLDAFARAVPAFEATRPQA